MHSTWCVCGNRSTGWTSSTLKPPRTSSDRSRASASGSQLTYATRMGLSRVSASMARGWHPARGGSSTTTSGRSSSDDSTSSVLPRRISTLPRSSTFASASRTAAADSSTATTRPALDASSAANVPTPAYASTTSSRPVSRSRLTMYSNIASAPGVLTWKKDGEAMRKRRPPSRSS